MHKKNGKPKAFPAMMALVLENRTSYLGAMLATVMIVIIGFSTPLVLAETIDFVLDTKPSTLPAFAVALIEGWGGREFLRANLWVMGAALILLNVINGVFTYVKGRLSAVASENISQRLRERLYAHLQRLPFAYHVKAETGDLIQRCTSDVDTIRRFLSVQVMEVVNSVLMIIIALVILLQRNVQITLLSMVLVPPLFVFATWFFSMVHKSFKEADLIVRLNITA